MSRRTARGQQLPPQEVELIASLSKTDLIQRVHDLYHAGWALDSIGASLQPTRPRSTIRSWVLRAEASPIPAIDAPIPIPRLKTPEGGYEKKKPHSPGIPQGLADIIKELAPLARGFRSRMATTAAQAVANDRLSGICITLHQKGVSITELAEAAGVTYRAMYKRVKL
jgi:DNA-binding Xre family transcriptional regulator